MSRPSEERVALGNHPVGGAIEMEDGECGGRRFCGYEGGYRGGRGDSLVEEGNAEKGAPQRGEDRECGLCLEASLSAMYGFRMIGVWYIFHLARHGHKRAPPRVEPLGRREGDGEQRVWRPQNLESGIYQLSANTSAIAAIQCLPAESREAPGYWPNASARRDSVVGVALIWIERHCQHTKPGLADDSFNPAFRDAQTSGEGPRMMGEGGRRRRWFC